MNNVLTNFGGDVVKKKCPFMEKCYRKNPIHFSEMSHPHLEKLIIDQLEGSVTVPAYLDFECNDRSQLLDQLKVLQMVLRKEREENGSGALPVHKKNVSKVETAVTDTSEVEGGLSHDLKRKVERNKIAMMARREAKLRRMDVLAESLSKPSTSNNNSDLNNSIVSKKDHKQERGNQNTEELKRGSKSSDVRSIVSKVSNINSKMGSCNLNPSKHSQENKESDKSTRCAQGTSIIEEFTACNSNTSRDDIREKAIEKMKLQGLDPSLVEPGNFALKYALSEPYHFFLTRITNSKPTYDQQSSITFPEILDKSLGQIVCSLQINFMIDLGWLCLQYLLASQRTNSLILYGERVDEEIVPSNIKMIHIQMPTSFGCHHSKVMVLKYDNGGIRIVVSTANLYLHDWENRTQGLWISPHLPPLPNSANSRNGESPTGFKKDFVCYLQKYKQPALTEWISAVRRADFSSVNVFFVASVPGSHRDSEYYSWGHKKLAKIFYNYVTLPPNSPHWPIIAQSSSIGSLGPKYESWLLKDIVASMSTEMNVGLKSRPNLQFIYPSIENYKQSFDVRNGACCLPYSLEVHKNQRWFESYLHQWKASKISRDQAMPHIKSYTRISPDLKEISWFVLTSANLSKSAWGTCRNSHYIMNYEAGVVFIPKLITGGTTFPIKEEPPEGTPVFPIPYDLPLTRYSAEDKPFVMEFFSGYE